MKRSVATLDSHFTLVPKKSKQEKKVVDEDLDKRIETALEHFNEHGWAIVKGVTSEEFCSDIESRALQWLEDLDSEGVIKRDNIKSLKAKDMPYSIHGIFQHYGVGHQDFIWDVRLHPNIKRVFEKIWQTEKLIVSFDGMNISRPGSGARAKPWPHVDQGGKDSSFLCAQGLLNLLPNGINDGGLCVLDKSNALHESFFKKNPDRVGPSDWVKFTEEEVKHYEGCEEIKICCDPGDFLLWDSRTVHYAKQPTSDKFRMAVYVCMQPRSLATDANLKKKQKAFHEQRMTSHWPAKTKLFNKDPRTYGNEEIINRFPVIKAKLTMTDEILRLAGVKPY